MAKVESTCPAFGKNFDPETEECGACADTFPNEYVECANICGVSVEIDKDEEKVENLEAEEAAVEEEESVEEVVENEEEPEEESEGGEELEPEEEEPAAPENVGAQDNQEEEEDEEEVEDEEVEEGEPEPEDEETQDNQIQEPVTDEELADLPPNEEEEEEDGLLSKPEFAKPGLSYAPGGPKKVTRNDAFVSMLKTGEKYTMTGFVKGLSELSPTLSVTGHPLSLQRWLKLLTSLNVVIQVGDYYSLIPELVD